MKSVLTVNFLGALCVSSILLLLAIRCIHFYVYYICILRIQVQLLNLFSLGLYVGDTVEEQNAKSDIREGDYMTIKKL